MKQVCSPGERTIPDGLMGFPATPSLGGLPCWKGEIMANIIVVEKEVLNSEAFRKLNGTAKTVYLDFLMKRQIKKVKARNGQKKKQVKILNNGEIQYTYGEAEMRGIPRKTFMRAIDSLMEHGFIDVTHSGSGGRKGDVSLYAICDRWKTYGTDMFVHNVRPKDQDSLPLGSFSDTLRVKTAEMVHQLKVRSGINYFCIVEFQKELRKRSICCRA